MQRLFISGSAIREAQIIVPRAGVLHQVRNPHPVSGQRVHVLRAIQDRQGAKGRGEQGVEEQEERE